ncbi:MAG TPA: DsbA family protein [Hyphomicrobiaceae bacterium]|nr:DsbA family protein [Hyphomicrobiaceae bacterium]
MPETQNLPSILKPALAGARGSIGRRRLMLASLAALGSAAASRWARPALAEERKGNSPAHLSVDELMQPGPLPDLAFGSPSAPITLVEYASLTCPHCAAFHNTVLPQLRQKYIATGRVRLVLREFPLDNLAAAASMLGRCAGEDKAFALYAVLFARQNEWAFVDKPVPELFRFAKLADFTKATFDACLKDQKLLDDIAAIRTRASRQFGVTVTPTFFVNGKRLERGATLEDFEKAFAAAPVKG